MREGGAWRGRSVPVGFRGVGVVQSGVAVRSGSGVVNSWQRGAFTSKVFQESEETRNSDLGFPIKPYFINRITVRIPLTLDLEVSHVRDSPLKSARLIGERRQGDQVDTPYTIANRLGLNNGHHGDSRGQGGSLIYHDHRERRESHGESLPVAQRGFFFILLSTKVPVGFIYSALIQKKVLA